MRERPILFSGPMVRAILDGRKTQTRRVVKPQPDTSSDGYARVKIGPHTHSGPTSYLLEKLAQFSSPFGVLGDRLWVRESCIISPKRFDGVRSDSYNVTDRDGDGRSCQYIASTPDTEAAESYGLKVTPSIHMPRWASRITLEVTGVRVERLQEISRADAKAEGFLPSDGNGLESWNGRSYGNAELAFAACWRDLNGASSWDQNPWVWVIEFRRLEVAA